MSEENGTKDEDQWEIGDAIAQAGYDIGRGLFWLGLLVCLGMVCSAVFAK